jgi:hypothetical protein
MVIGTGPPPEKRPSDAGLPLDNDVWFDRLDELAEDEGLGQTAVSLLRYAQQLDGTFDRAALMEHPRDCLAERVRLATLLSMWLTGQGMCKRFESPSAYWRLVNVTNFQLQLLRMLLRYLERAPIGTMRHLQDFNAGLDLAAALMLQRKQQNRMYRLCKSSDIEGGEESSQSGGGAAESSNQGISAQRRGSPVSWLSWDSQDACQDTASNSGGNSSAGGASGSGGGAGGGGGADSGVAGAMGGGSKYGFGKAAGNSGVSGEQHSHKWGIVMDPDADDEGYTPQEWELLEVPYKVILVMLNLQLEGCVPTSVASAAFEMNHTRAAGRRSVLTLIVQACGTFDHRESTVIQRICQEICMQLPSLRPLVVGVVHAHLWSLCYEKRQVRYGCAEERKRVEREKRRKGEGPGRIESRAAWSGYGAGYDGAHDGLHGVYIGGQANDQDRGKGSAGHVAWSSSQSDAVQHHRMMQGDSNTALIILGK